MLNLLIISNNFDDSKNLLNYISQNSALIRVYSIVNTIPELTQIINTGIIDLILIDIDQLKNNFILDINHILQPYYKIYEKSIIILSNNSDSQSILNNYYIYSYVKKDKNYKLLLEKLEKNCKFFKLNKYQAKYFKTTSFDKKRIRVYRI